VLGPEP